MVGTLVAIAALLQLFLGRDVGLAANGDGARAMCGIGLGRSGGLRSVLSFDWHVAAPKVCQARPLWAYHSSYSALLKPVVAVARLVTGHEDLTCACSASRGVCSWGSRSAAWSLLSQGQHAAASR